MKYTAYSGWISSGLVSWTIDKAVVSDSFGKSLSVCKKGLVLESGRPVYLPLYPGDCNVPDDTATNATSTAFIEIPADERTGGIGPFTRSQNYPKKDSFVVDGYVKDKGNGGTFIFFSFLHINNNNVH